MHLKKHTEICRKKKQLANDLIGMNDNFRVSNREIASRLLISENYIRNTLETFKTTDGVQHHLESRRLKKQTNKQTKCKKKTFKKITESLLFCQAKVNTRLSYP